MTTGAAKLFSSRPRAVLCDLGFTLMFWHGERIAEHAAAMGVTVDPERLIATERTLRAKLHSYGFGHTRDSAPKPAAAGPDFFKHMLELAGAKGSPADLARAGEHIWTQHLRKNVWCRPGDGVIESLRSLHEAGIQLGIVSNSEGTIRALLTDLGLVDLFQTIVDSWVEGVTKPDPRIFQLALDRLGGMAPSEAVMVGDSYPADVLGARAAGIPAVLLDPWDFHPEADAPRFPTFAAFTDALLAI